jgi:hypothetical protein
MERRVIGNFHARCEVGEKPESISGAYLSLSEVNEDDTGVLPATITGWYTEVYEPTFAAAE